MVQIFGRTRPVSISQPRCNSGQSSQLLLIAIAAVAPLACISYAAEGQTTWFVDDDAPGDPGPGTPLISDPQEDGSLKHPYDAIQEALDAALAGDEIVVGDGLYVGSGNRDLAFSVSALLRSQSGAAQCIIDCESAGRGFVLTTAPVGELEIRGFTITNGSAGDFGGGLIVGRGQPIRVYDCTFIANSATFTGGAIYATGAEMRFEACSFVANTAVIAPAVYAIDGTLALEACIFSMNAGAADGALFNDVNNTCGVTNCLFAGNMATSAIGGGGAILNNDAPLEITNCTLVNNSSANVAGAIWADGGTVEVTNCILWGNTASQGSQLFAEDGASVIFSYSDTEGGASGIDSEKGSSIAFLVGNIDADPIFVASPFDYRLSQGSPCIDAADNTASGLAAITSDLDSNVRFANDLESRDTGNGNCPIVDMGAYEFPSSCPWDADCDNQVGITDFLDLLAKWGTNPGGPPDVNGDGIVGISDLLALLANWGPCP